MGFRLLVSLLLLSLLGGLSLPASADDAGKVAELEKAATADIAAGAYGPADEKIRAAIALADNESFNRLALLQGLVALKMGGDGRSLMGAAIAAHQSNAWPRPVIAYLLEERKLQQVADEIGRSGNSFETKRQQICELSFYAGVFTASDGERKFAKRLLDKALSACDPGSPLEAMTNAELAALAAEP